MNKEFVWTDAEVKKILHAATGNIKDFVMDNDGFLEQFKSSHTEAKRDWEIITVINKVSKAALPYSEPFYPEYWDISSVRRLSDNEVFSVGDKIIVHRNSGYYGQRTIERFELKDGVMKEIDEFGESRLDQISKPLQRTPLFKDFHGNDVFEGDRVWWIVIHNNNLWTINNEVMKSDTSFSHNRVFTSDFAAKEYRLMNKPSLSVSDILSMDMNMDLTDRVLIWKDKLIEKAKNKS